MSSDLDTIQEVRIVATVEGDAEAIRRAGQLGAAIDGVVTKTDSLTKAQISAQRQLEATAKKYDAEYRAVTELARAQSLLDRARSQGLSTMEAYGRVQDVVTAKLQAQSNAAKVANDNLLKLAAAANAQKSVNAATGVRTDFGTADRAEDIAAYGAELDRLRAKFVPLFAIQQRYAQQQAEISDALKVGAISANEAAAAQLRLSGAYQDQLQKLERLGQAQKESAQRQVNSRLIVPDRSGDIAAYGEELDRLQARFDPLFRAEQAYISTVEELERALSVGAISLKVYNARIAEQGEILDAAVAKISGVAEAQERAAQAAKTASAAQDEYNRILGVKTDFNTAGRAADVEAYGQALNSTRAKYDPLFAAQQRYLGGLRDLRAALAAGVIDQDIFARNLAAQKQAFAEQVNGLGLYSRAQREAASAAQAAAQAAQDAVNKARAQSAVNARIVVPNRSEDIQAYGKELDDLRAKFSPLFAAERQYEAVVEEINAAVRVGAITEKERAVALGTARARLLDQTNEIRKAEEANGRLTKTVGLNAYAWTNLGYQVNDVVTSLASGISPFQTLTQQGGQIYQILQSGQGGVGGALAAIKERLLALAGSPVGAVVGIGAAFATAAVLAYRFIAAQRDVELSLLGSGKAAGLTAEQIQSIAERASRAGDITVSSAREIARAFLDTGKILGDAFLPGILAAEKFAKAKGISELEAGKTIAAGLSTLGTGGFEELAAKAGNFDAALEKQVRDLIRTGDEMQAMVIVAQRFGQAFDESGNKLTGLQRKLADADQYVKNLAESFGKVVAQRIGAAPIPMEEQLERNVSALRTRRAVAPDADTSALEAEGARIRAELKRTADTAETEAKRARQNANALKKDAISALVPELASFERIQQQRVEANKALNALENTPGADAQRIEAAKNAVAAAAAAERDYAAAGGPANMERAKATELLKAGFAARAAVTPVEKAEAARLQALAETYGTLTPLAERNARAEDARTKVLQEQSVESRNQSRAQTEATRTANELAGATTATGRSIEYLAAARKVDEQIAAGSIDKAERETKIREQLQSRLGEVNRATAERIRTAREQTTVQEGLTQKVVAGTMASAEAQRRIGPETELRKLAIERDAAAGEAKAELAKRYDELRAAQEAQLSTEDRAKLAGLTEEENRRIDLLQREAGLLGQTTRERQAALVVLQAEADLKRQGISTSSPEATAYLNRVRLRADLDTAKAEYERLAQEISSVVSGIFDDLFKAGNKGFAGFADSFARGFSRIGTRLIEQNIIAPLFTGGLGGGASGSGGLGGLFSGIQSLFGGDRIERAVQSGTANGLTSAAEDAARRAPAAGGASSAFSRSPIGGGILSAVSGAAIGYQAQSPLMGAFGGGLAGLASGGPVGAVIGAGAGLLGGLFGQSQARRERARQIRERVQELRQAYEEQSGQIDQLSRTLQGRSLGNVEGQVSQAFEQMRSANRVASQGGDQATADRLVREFEQYRARLRAAFSEAFAGTEAEIRRGFGTSGPFAAAAQAVVALGDALRAFVVDTEAARGVASAEQARQAAVQGALASLRTPETLSDTQAALARIGGTAAGLRGVFVGLGVSAEDAGRAIEDGVRGALGQLRDTFNEDVGRKLNDAKGLGYLNDTIDLLREVQGMRVDAGAIGGDLRTVNEYMAAAAQRIVNEAGLTGAAFDDLVRIFPELNGQVHAFSAAATQTAEDLAAAADALAQRRTGYQDRTFAAGLDTSTQAGALAAFDRQAATERAAEVKAGGQAIADLEEALAAERLGIIRDFADKAAEALRTRLAGYADRFFAATNDASTLEGQLAAYDRQAQRERVEEAAAGGQALADLEAAQFAERLKLVRDYQEQAASAEKQRMEAAQAAFDTFARNIKQFVDGLRAGSGSPLSPQARLAAAQSQYNAQLTLAQSGNRTALDGITGYASDLLDAGKAFYASSAAFQTLFAQVTGQLTALPTQVSPEQFIVDAVNANGTAVVNATTAMQNTLRSAIQANSPSLTAAALNANFDRLDTSVNGLLDYGELRAGLGPLATVSEQQAAAAIFRSIDADGDGQITRLEAIRATAQGTTDIVNITGNQIRNSSDGVGAQVVAGNNVLVRQNQILDAINAINNAQKAVLDTQQGTAKAIEQWTASTFTGVGNSNAILGQLKSVNDAINASSANSSSQNNFVQQNTAYTNKLLADQYNTLASTFTQETRILQNLQSANIKNGANVYARGGLVEGPGTGTSDSIPAMLSNREYVMTAEAVRRLGVPMLDALNDNRFVPPVLAMPLPMPSAMGDGGMLAELRALRAEVAALRGERKDGDRMVAGAVVSGAEHVANHVDGVKGAVEDGQRPNPLAA